MYCPNCEAEYQEGITVCPDCNIRLVKDLTEPPHDDRPLVEIFSTDEVALIPLVHSILDSSDIPYAMRDEEGMGIFPGAGMGLAIDASGKGVQVLVSPDHADRARQILEDIKEGAAYPVTQEDGTPGMLDGDEDDEDDDDGDSDGGDD